MDKQQFFNAWAATYDWLFPSVIYQAAHRQMLDWVDLPHQATVLDIGCGTGHLLFRLLNHYPDLQGTGLDFSPEMLRQARQARGDRTSLIFVQGDAEALRFADAQFDAVFCTFSFMHYPHPQQVLAEVHRVLRPEGQLYLLDPVLVSPFQRRRLPISPNGIRLYSRGDRAALAESTNFSLVRHVPILLVSLLTILQKS
jgi:ubiquinone/menaquinone biosynthesis C-methylase UbiE